MKGKPWTIEEEKQLRDLVEQKKSLAFMAKTLGKSVDDVRQKLIRLGLKVVGTQICNPTTTNELSSKELPNIEQALRMLNKALIQALNRRRLESLFQMVA